MHDSVYTCMWVEHVTSLCLVILVVFCVLFYRAFDQGPILGGTFGTVMHNKSLRNLGIKNELIGLLICLISGRYQITLHCSVSLTSRILHCGCFYIRSKYTTIICGDNTSL